MSKISPSAGKLIAIPKSASLTSSDKGTIKTVKRKNFSREVNSQMIKTKSTGRAINQKNSVATNAP